MDIGRVCISHGTLLVFLSFLKKEQRERKEERSKRLGENRRERTAQSFEIYSQILPSAVLKYAVGKHSHLAPS